MTGFGFKTEWIAVRGGSAQAVADAIGLRGRRTLGWAEGTAQAYGHGVYVAPPVEGWVLAHGGRAEGLPVNDPTDPAALDWLRALSAALGEVHYFQNYRGWSAYAWMLARDGEVERAYALFDSAAPLFVGHPTVAEIALGVGLRGFDEGWAEWGEEEWEAWYLTTPDEVDVLSVAGSWGIDPRGLSPESAPGTGIHGVIPRPGADPAPAAAAAPPKQRAARHRWRGAPAARDSARSNAPEES